MSKNSRVVDIQETLLMDLPSEIITKILSRLPVRSIISCKYVCKEFLQIILTHEFATTHLSVSNPPGLVIHQHQKESLFKLLEYEDTLKLQSNNFRDLELMKFEPNTFLGTTSPITCLGSVHGFLCFGHISDTHDFAVYICNPITRELIHIPMPKQAIKAPYFDRSGFGLSGLSGQYKVVVNYNLNRLNECLVYTLGTTGSWRSVAPDPKIVANTQTTSGQVMNGNLHWLVTDDDDVALISCFDLETEQFKYISPPQNWKGVTESATLVILEDCLCLCGSESDDSDMVLWIMKEYGIEKCWTRQFEISKRWLLEDYSSSCYDSIFPVKAFADGGILFSWENELLFYYCDKTKSTRSVEVYEDNSRGDHEDAGYIETLTHTFSFISMKCFGVENVISF